MSKILAKLDKELVLLGGLAAGCAMGLGLGLWLKRARPVDFGDELTTKGLGALNINLIGLGHELGLFDQLCIGPLTSAELAARCSCDARYIKEWCLHMVATKVLDFHSEHERFAVPKRVRPALQDPMRISMAYNAPAAIMQRDKLANAFKTGAGIPWSDLDHRAFCGTAMFFQPLYEQHLLPNLPTEVWERFEAGGTLADVGCGEGISCTVLAKAFPKLQVIGYDYHQPSVEQARIRGKGISNLFFETADAKGFGDGKLFDVVTFFDCFHDMATAGAAAVQAFKVLKPGGIVFLIELPAAEHDSVQEQLCLPTTPIFSAFSCHVCLPCGKCNNGDALGTVCPTSKHRELFVQRAGFKSLTLIPSGLNAMGFRVLLVHK